MVFTPQEVSRMIFEMRKEGKTLPEISQKITHECCVNYNCKDNVTVILVDLKKTHIAHQLRVKR